MKNKLVFLCLPLLILLTGCVDFDLPVARLFWLVDMISVNDGGRVAIAIDDEIYLTDLKGDYFEQISEDENDKSAPVWSPDGKSLLYIEEGTDIWQLKIYVPGDRQTDTLLQEMHTIALPAFAPSAAMVSYLVVEDDSGLSGTLNVYEEESARIYPLLQDVYPDYEWLPGSREIAAIVVTSYQDSDEMIFQGMLIVKDIVSLAERVVFNGYFLSGDSSLDLTADGKSLIFSASTDPLNEEAQALAEQLTIFHYDYRDDSLAKWQGPSGYDFRLPGAVSSTLNGYVLAKARGGEEEWSGQLYLIKGKQKLAVPGWPLWLKKPVLVYLDTGERVDLQEKFEEIYGEQ